MSNTQKARDLDWEESFINKVEVEMTKRRETCAKAQASVACPVCGAKPGETCGYIAYDKHFGENLPDGWTHAARREESAKVEKALLASML